MFMLNTDEIETKKKKSFDRAFSLCRYFLRATKMNHRGSEKKKLKQERLEEYENKGKVIDSDNKLLRIIIE